MGSDSTTPVVKSSAQAVGKGAAAAGGAGKLPRLCPVVLVTV